MNGDKDTSTAYKFGQIETTLKNTANELIVWKEENASRHGMLVASLKELDKKVNDLDDKLTCLKEEFIGYKIRMGLITGGVALLASVGTSVVTALIINNIIV
jgi:hypothetical protein